LTRSSGATAGDASKLPANLANAKEIASRLPCLRVRLETSSAHYAASPEQHL
jgi:hypothetical protein